MLVYQEDTVNRLSCSAVCLSLLLPAVSIAQTAPTPSGHWEGSLSVPSGNLTMLVDLEQDSTGGWIGDIDIPERNVSDLPLQNVTVSGGAIGFGLLVGAGAPAFQGKLSDDGKTLAGDFSQNGLNVPLSFTRTGEAKVYVQPKNAALPEQSVGKWEGSLEIGGATLRVAFNLESRDGAAAGTIDSIDQGAGANGIPMDAISATDNTLTVSVRAVSGSYSGKLSEDRTSMTGEWSQRGNTQPLVLKKAAPANQTAK